MQRLAVGGMAEVFLARRLDPNGRERRVALKRILPHLAKQPDFVAMFLDEARLAAQLDHPHIVRLHDFGVDADTYYLAMEYVCGEDLAVLARRAAELGRPLSPIEVALILLPASLALDHAHAHDIVHRDVTPANLLVSFEGVVKLADFGIAKSQAAASLAQTNAGTLKGKIPYMSPEQARAQPIDRRSDLFSLGIVGWELLTGKRLFARRSDLDMLRAVQMCDVPPLTRVRPQVPAALAQVIDTALAPAREDRFTSAGALAQALADWLVTAGGGVGSAPLAASMTRLFGKEAASARRRVFCRSPEATRANLPLPAAAESSNGWPDAPLAVDPALDGGRSATAALSPLRLLGPGLALLISLGGLLFGLHSPQAHRSRPPAAAALPPLLPQVLVLHPDTPHLRLPAPSLRPPPASPPDLERPDAGAPPPKVKPRRLRRVRGMLAPRRQAWPTVSGWQITFDGTRI